MLNFAITDAELAALHLAKTSAENKLTDYNNLTAAEQKQAREPSIERAIYDSVNNIIDQRTITGWTSSGHTGVDVPVFAIGKQKELFYGLSDNTEIAEKIFHLLGKK